MFLILLYLLFHLHCHFAASVSIPSTIPSLLAPNVSIPETNHTLTSSAPNNHTFTGPATLLPYRYNVPNSDIYIRYGFGLLRRSRTPLPPTPLANLLATTLSSTQTAVLAHGASTLYPVRYDLRQLVWAESGSVKVWFRDVPEGKEDAYFTWGQVRDVLEGLEEVLVRGGRSWETTFSFWGGGQSGWLTPLGFGMVEGVDDGRGFS